MDTGLLTPHRALKPVCLAFFLLLGLQAVSLCAQDEGATGEASLKDHPLLGSWILEDPVQGNLFLIVRDTGLVSFFWEHWEDGQVLRSKWETFGQGIYFALDTNEKILMNPSGDNTAQALVYKSGREIDGKPDKLAPGKKLDPEQVGKWHNPNSNEEEESKFLKTSGNIDVFFGTWEVISSKGLPYYIVIERDRSAATNWPYSERGVDGMRGFWVRQGSELHIIWDTGHYDILRSFSDKYIKLGYPPGVDLDSVEPQPQPALKVDWFPHEPWRANYEQSKKMETTRDHRWTSARRAAKYFRGDWKIMSSQGQWADLEMGRFGSCRSQRDGEELEGSWKNASDYATLRWNNGYIELLRPVGKHFVTLVYSPLKNLDGIPDRVCPLVPADGRKFFKVPKFFDQ